MPCEEQDSLTRRKFGPIGLPCQRTCPWDKAQPGGWAAQQLQCCLLYDSRLTLVFPAVNNDNGKYWSGGINIKSVFRLPATFPGAWAILFINPGEFGNY